MTDNATSVSVIINAPVDHVWPLLLETQQSPDQQKRIQRAPKGESVEGQVIRIRLGPFRSTGSIDKIILMEPPLVGQTIFGRISFFGKEGQSVVRWMRDSERHILQTQSDLKHPWCTSTENINIQCVTVNVNACVVVYVGQLEMTLRLLPRWFTRKLDSIGKKVKAEAIEAALQKIKIRAEQSLD